MSSPAPGWYPDPAQSGGTRWWNGSAWTEQVTPPAQTWGAPQQQWAPTGQPWGAQQPQQQWPATASPWDTRPAAPPHWFKRNAMSLATVGVVLAYVALLAFAHITVLGVLPIALAAQAVRNKEPMAIPAAVVAGLALVLALYELTAR